MGGAGGGQINIVTHSGSSQYHGTIYEFSTQWRDGCQQPFASMGNNHLVQNDFGASFGGLLIGKKTFFFVNYEGPAPRAGRRPDSDRPHARTKSWAISA